MYCWENFPNFKRFRLRLCMFFRGMTFLNRVKGYLGTFGISLWKFLFLILIVAESISAAVKSTPLRDTVPLPVLFQPKGPGHYPCQITLKSAYDIRVYQLECTVCPEGSVLELDFITPTHQSVTQDIPVVNITYILVCKRNASRPTESTTNLVVCTGLY